MPFEDNHHQDDNSSDDDDGRAAPAFAVSKRNRGWQGEQLELQHSAMTTDKKDSQVVAVDLNQFRNKAVGEGYQAKHVIRQKGISASNSGPAAPKQSDSHASKKQKSSHQNHINSSQDSSNGRKETPKSRTDKYLRSTGLRRFRKELAKIESSS